MTKEVAFFLKMSKNELKLFKKTRRIFRLRKTHHAELLGLYPPVISKNNCNVHFTECFLKLSSSISLMKHISFGKPLQLLHFNIIIHSYIKSVYTEETATI